MVTIQETVIPVWDLFTIPKYDARQSNAPNSMNSHSGIIYTYWINM